MKSTLALLAGLLMAVTLFAQAPDCKKFRNGTFYYPTIPDKTSVRKDSIQESYNNGKLEMIWKVNWLNDCEYELICQKVLVSPHPLKKNDKIVATIVKTDGDCFSTTLVFYNEEFPGGRMIPSGWMCFQKE